MGWFTDIEERVLCRRILLQTTLEEIGKLEGRSRERIRQIEAKAIEKLHRSLRGGNREPELSSVESLPLTVRSICALKRTNILTIEQLTNSTELELLDIPNFGRKSLLDVKEALSTRGLTLLSSQLNYEI